MANPLIWASIADKLLGVLEKFLDPRQYNIVRLKRMHKALNIAEKEFEICSELLAWVGDNISATVYVNYEHGIKELNRMKRTHEKLKARFDKYD